MSETNLERSAGNEKAKEAKEASNPSSGPEAVEERKGWHKRTLTEFEREAEDRVSARRSADTKMKDQDSATIVITFLLLLPWLVRAAVSTMAVWRAHTESQIKKAESEIRAWKELT